LVDGAVDENPSATPEKASLAGLDRSSRQKRNRRDIEIINNNADRINREVEDVLEYQQIW
jgi:hypothetical protein